MRILTWALLLGDVFYDFGIQIGSLFISGFVLALILIFTRGIILNALFGPAQMRRGPAAYQAGTNHQRQQSGFNQFEYQRPPDPTQITHIYCESCGDTNDVDSQFCVSCGSSFFEKSTSNSDSFK